MNIKTNLLENYVDFVDSTKKQNEYSKIFVIFLVVVVSFFIVLFNYMNE